MGLFKYVVSKKSLIEFGYTSIGINLQKYSRFRMAFTSLFWGKRKFKFEIRKDQIISYVHASSLKMY